MRLFKTVAATALLLMAGVAQAATTLKFVLSGDLDATWTAPASPVPSFVGGAAFYLNVTGTWDGVPRARTLYFYTESGGGGIAITGSPSFLSDGPQLFTGTVDSPTFRTGTFALTRFQPSLAGNGTLTISNAVPEPASWAMLIAGFGLVGAAMRRRGVAVA